MHSDIKFKHTKKGYISVYTLVISSIILLISIYMLSFQYEGYLYSLNSFKALKNESSILDRKEALKTKLDKILKQEIKHISEEELKEFLGKNNGKHLLENKDEKILVSGENIIFRYKIRNNVFKEDKSCIKIYNNKFILIRQNNTYYNG
ncbi:hypothetical protein ACOAKC_06265 [Hathewaya histolytica]|uniref:hypothetical protein n=1 Tax=Hathewaya histolytica TaxID=1498 RepID=UPI003B67EB7B